MPWPVHPNGLLGAQGGDNDSYRIERSLRFNTADSAYVSKTYASGTAATTLTISCWIKRSSLSTTSSIFASRSGNTVAQLEFASDDKLSFVGTNSAGSITMNIKTSDIFRDVAAWYHLVLLVDTTQATASDRVKIYVNGSQITSFTTSTYPAQNSTYAIFGATEHSLGGRLLVGSGVDSYFSGYLTETIAIDGQALTPSSFGETDAITGRWKAKAYSGTYGNNGFYLKFADNSSTAALGTDSSGNGNTWTTNNFSVATSTLADKVANDSLVDSPTNYGTDTGVGGEVRGNYATLNPISTLRSTIIDGALRTNAGDRGSISTIGMTSGKWFCEMYVTALGAESSVGISRGINIMNSYVGSSSDSWGYYYNGLKYNNASSASYGSSYTTGDTIGAAFDADAGTIVFYKNGTSQGTAYTSLTSGPYYFATSGRSSTSANDVTMNFGQQAWRYAPPTGFKALCTTNLPTPTIGKPSSYMDVVTYTGTGSALTPTSSLGFSPDLIWLKSRSAATDYALYDTVRGVQNRLESNTTDAEVTSDSGVTAFNSSGFTLGTLSQANTNTATYVAWAWDAGSSSITNTTGSITSTVRANPQNGVSVVGYTGNGTAGATVGHGLGVSPSMIITKKRSTATSSQWTVGFSALGWNRYILLNSTAAAATDSNVWNSAPTSSVFYLGNDIWNNHSGQTTIAYCFAEIEGFSKFGSYTGNSSADGPFVWCGFRPRFVLAKNSSSGGAGYDWVIWDAARNPSNQTAKVVFPDLANAEEETTTIIDILSSGFKLRNSGATTNAGTMIFAAFAESPFKYARAR